MNPTNGSRGVSNDVTGGVTPTASSTATSPPPIPPTPNPESVSVVVLTFDGKAHLEAGLPAMLALQGLAGPAAIVIADNGSADDSIDWLKRAQSAVTLLELGENLGFAAGYNRALKSLDAEWVLLLNNDTRPAPDVLVRLCDAIAATAHETLSGHADASTIADGPVVCAGARLVDWPGQRLDFDGGGMALSGHGHALGHGSNIPRAGAPHPTLFCSGAAMLVHRKTFLQLGGFDPDYFAYYEDVDFGWRLWSAGFRALHVPGAVVRHRGGGSATTLGDGRRARLHERNAIMTVIKNAEPALAPQWIRTALVLAAWRAAGGAAGLGMVEEAAHGENIQDGAALFPADDWAGWQHLEPFELDLGALQSARARVQAQRQRSDAEIIPLMRYPWAPVPPSVEGWTALRRAADVFRLEEIFGRFGGQGVRASAGRLVSAIHLEGFQGIVKLGRAKRQRWQWLAATPRRPAGRMERAQPLNDPHPADHPRPAAFGDPIDIVLVNYEGRELLEACLPGLEAQDYPSFRLIVADNGSQDGTVAWLRAARPDIDVLDLGENLGFAEANNRAITASDAPWVALVNTDTLPEPGWLSALVRAADGRPAVGSVASRMLFMDRPEIVQSAGIAIDPSGIAWDRLGGAPAEAADVPGTVFGASAGAALYRRAALEDVAEEGAYFDRKFFMYLEDVDLAWRLRLRGWDAAYAPEATILHEGSATSGEGSAFKNRLLARNKVWFVLKCYPARGLARYGLFVLAYDLASVPYRVVFAGQGAALRGRIDALSSLGRVLGQRRNIQSGRRAEWPGIRAVMEPLATPLGILRRYKHLIPSKGVVDTFEGSEHDPAQKTG